MKHPPKACPKPFCNWLGCGLCGRELVGILIVLAALAGFGLWAFFRFYPCCRLGLL